MKNAFTIEARSGLESPLSHLTSHYLLSKYFLTYGDVCNKILSDNNFIEKIVRSNSSKCKSCLQQKPRESHTPGK